MAIDLLNSFLQRAQNLTSNQKGNASQTTQAAQSTQSLPQNLQVMRAMRALQAGQTIQGEVVSVKGKEVQLAILKDVIIDAKLAGSMNLTPGVTMPFQVKANNSQGLSLIPLFTNIAADPNVLKALDMAQIPVGDRSLEMVQTLMEKGMPIDKQSIQEMYREVVGFKDVPVKDIVTLHQMGLAVNRENLTQLSLYQNNQHYLKDTFSDIGNAIGGQLESLIAEGNTDKAIQLINNLQQIFQGTQTDKTAAALGNMLSGSEDFDNTIPADSDAKTVLVSEKAVQEGGVQEAASQGKAMTAILTEDMLLRDGKVIIKEEAAQNPNISEKQSPESVKSDTSIVENLSQDKEGKKDLNLSDSTMKEVIDWKDLADSILKDKTSGKAAQLFEKIWDKEISKNWLMEPEAIADKKAVKEYYEKLSHQMKQLEKLFEDGTSMKNPVAKVIQNTTSNLDFMNQLNQMHAYIQLPLKMANREAHGELYVFTNKKNLTKQEGKVTALLHLDMEYLGKMDVYVALENKNVSTNFYLEKEEYLDFLEAHMELLTARLNKRGYQCDIKTTLRNEEEEESVIKTIEKQQGSPMLLSMQAFDVRA